VDTSQQSSFAHLLKQYRVAAGLSQEALAAQAGISAHGISDLERGINRSPRLETLALMVAALRLSPDEQATLEAAVQRRRSPRGDAPATPSDHTGDANDATTPTTLTALPIPPTALVGRDDDVAAVTALLRDEARLLTLAGPGGIGKTRLALQVAIDLQARQVFDGVAFVHLADIPNADMVPAAIARALGLREHDNRTSHQVLATYLDGKRMLLVLDNFEHVAAAAVPVAELLASCPGLRVLVTSRTVLHVRGERVYEAPPRVVPDRARMHDAAAVAGCAATQLFLARAREIVPDLALTDANASLIARICARLDGLPLAIELAAARLKVLAPDALLDRLESGLQVLSGGARDLPERQRTLRATLAWSYALLDAPAQALFLRLAVFAGGCTLEAIESLTDTGNAAGGKMNAAEAEPEDLLETVSALIDNSLLRREARAGEVRFTMLQTVREYALERLQGYGALDALRGHHAAYFLAMAEDAERDRAGAAQAAWAARLEREQDNLRAALGFALVSGHVKMALRLAGALRWFWLAHGYLSEGRRWLAQALAAADAMGLADAEVAAALNHAAVLAATANAYGEAGALFERGLAIRQALGDEPGAAAMLSNLGLVAMHQHDHERAATFFADALAIFRLLGETQSVARVLGNLGELARLRGDGARAVTWATESFTLYEQMDDPLGAAQARHTLGGASLLRNDIAGATIAFSDALARSWRLGNIIETANNLEGLAVVAARLKQYDRAALLFESAAVVREASEAPVTPVDRAMNEQALAVTRAGLSTEALAAARMTGRSASLPWVVTLVLGDASPMSEAEQENAAALLQAAGRKTG